MSGWLGNLPLAASAALFLGAAAVVWLSGTRLARLADAIACRTGIGQATLGVLLLGGVTSMPEIAVAGSAALAGNGPLAVNTCWAASPCRWRFWLWQTRSSAVAR